MKDMACLYKTGALCALALIVSACAVRAPVPVDEMNSAALAIAKAEEARGAEFAPVPLNEARQKLALARSEIEQGSGDDYTAARQLAEQARADAELANSIADSSKAQIAALEVDRTLQAMRRPLRR